MSVETQLALEFTGMVIALVGLATLTLFAALGIVELVVAAVRRLSSTLTK